MKDSIDLSSILAAVEGDTTRRLRVFALLGLGIVDSISNGVMSTTDAVNVFFNAQNCHTTKKILRHDTADEVMGRGVQLPDLFEALAEPEAQQEFQREIAAIRSLCLQLLTLHLAVA